MSLPNTLNKATPADSDNVSDGDDQIRALKTYLVDVMGFPDNVAVSVAPFSITDVGAVTVPVSLAVTGVSELTGAVDTASTLDVGGAVELTGAVDTGSTLAVAGAVDTGSTLDVTGAATFDNTVAISGATDANSTFRAGGASTLVGAVDTGSTLDVTGATTLDSTLSVTDITSLSDHVDVVDGKSIRDGNNNELVTWLQVASAVNEFTVSNAATGNGPELQATGGNTDIDIELVPKGAGLVKVLGEDTYEVGGIIDRDVTSQEVVNTVTETTIYTYSIPADTFSTNRAVRVTMVGDYLNNSAGTPDFTVKLKLGSTTVLNRVESSVAVDTARRAVILKGIISAANSTSAQIAAGQMHFAAAGDGVTGTMGTNNSNSMGLRNNVAEDTTGALTLAITVTHSIANSAISYILRFVQLELL